MKLPYSTSTDDGTFSFAADQPSDVSATDVVGKFDTEVAPRATIALQRELAAIELASSAETSQTSAVPDAVANNWALLAKSKLSKKIYGRILRLAQEAESPEEVALRPGSLRTFLSFWDTVSVLASEPEITLAGNGNLVAEWHRRWNCHLDVEFKEDGMILYGLFTGRIVSEGRDVADALARRLIETRRWPV